MQNNQLIMPILSAADRGYDLGELRIDEDLERGERGDTLADFIAIEIREVTQGIEDFDAAKEEALRAMNVALKQLQDVIHEIEKVDAPE
jgi:hypothetical protein